MYRAQGALDKAEPLCNRALAIYEKELGPNHPSTATALSNLALLYQAQGALNQAEPLYKRALAIYEKALGPNHLSTAMALNNLALLYQAQGAFEQAEPLYKRARTIYEKALRPNHLSTAMALNNLASLYKAQGALNQAEPLYKRALAIYEKALGPNHLSTAMALNNLASLYLVQEAFEQAEPLYKRARTIYEKTLGPNHPSTAIALNNLASLYKAQGAFEQAESLYKRALTIRKKMLGPGHPSTATSLGNLASLYKAQGAFKQAESLYKRALAIHEKVLGPGHPSTATSLNNLAKLHQNQGAFDQAESLYKRALTIREKALGPDHPSTATSLNDLAQLYMYQGAFDRAEPLYERAIAIYEKALGPDHSSTAKSLNNLALLYQNQGAFNQAEPLYESALAITQKALGPNHPNTARCLSNLGSLYQEQGAFDKAESFYKQALAITQRVLGPDHPSTATSLSNLGGLYSAQQAFSEAEPLYKRALAVYKNVWGPDHLTTALALSNLATLKLNQGRLNDALADYQRSLDIEEKNLTRTLTVANDSRRLAYVSTLLGSFYGMLSVHLRAAPNHRLAATLALTTLLRRKGRTQDLTAHSYANLQRSLSAEYQYLLDDLAQARRQYAALARRGPTKGAEEQFTSQLGALQKEQDRVWDELTQVSPEIRTRTAAVMIEDIQQALPCRSALVEFAMYFPAHNDNGVLVPVVQTPRYAAYLVLPNRIDWVDLGPAEAIDGRVATFRVAVAAEREDIEAEAQALYALVMEPVVKHLDDSDTRQLFIAPDDQLNLVPFGALHDGKRYLIESYALRYLTTGRDLLRPWDAGTGTQDSVVAVVNPKGAGLDGTESEANLLRDLFPGSFKKLVGAQATENQVVKRTRPRILHLGTHGFFNTQRSSPNPRSSLRTWTGTQTPVVHIDNPMLRSGLVLAENGDTPSDDRTDDGILTAYEVSDWDLRGTQLVTLSACETALGELELGEGVFGLRRAFVLAGAQTQVMSLWKISDTVTPAVMESFYRRLKSGEGRGEAMQNAQLEMLRSRTHSHPFYWAAFVVSGEWRPLSRPGAPEPPPVSRCGCRASIVDTEGGGHAGLLMLLLLVGRCGRVHCDRRASGTG